MAKLPQYEKQAPLMTDVPQLQTPQYSAYAKRSESIQGALDTIGKFARAEAERAVIKQAQEYTVANPLTIEQLNAAKDDGINPIEAALNGGMVWNDAVTKLYAQQASAELTNESYKHFDNVLVRVENGELTGHDDIQQAIEAPIKAWQNVIAQIDPAEANSFYLKSITNGSSYYRKSLTELKKQEQLRQDLISDESYKGLLRQFEIDLDSGLAPEIVLQKYLNDKESAKKLFKNSSRAATLQNEVENEFTRALYRHMSRQFQTMYGSKDEFLDAAAKGELGAYSGIYDQFTPIQKDALEDYVAADFNRIDNANNAALTSVTKNGKSIRDALINDGANPERLLDNIENYKTQADTISGNNSVAAQADVELTKATLNIATKMRGMDINQMKQHVAKMKQRGDNEVLIGIAETFVSKAETAKTKDSVDYILSRNDAEYGAIEYDPETGTVLLANFEDQIAKVKSSPDYKKGGPLLTKAQKDELVQTLTNPDGTTNLGQINLATQIVSIFGDDADAVFNQIADKNPVFAHMGVLAMEGTPDMAATLRTMVNGESQKKLNKINITNKIRSSDSAVKLVSGLVNVHGADAERILAAAEAYYIGNGGNLETIQDNDVRQALFAVTGGFVSSDGVRYGGVGEVNGRLVILDGQYKTDQVEEYIQDLPVEAFAKAFINNPDKTLSTIEGYKGNEIFNYSEEDLNGASLINWGDAYALVNEDGVPFKDVNGNEIKVDLDILRQHWETLQYAGPLDEPVRYGTGRGLEEAGMRRQDEYAKRKQEELQGKEEKVPYKVQQIKRIQERAKKATKE
jgi:hypothetical protein